MEIHLSFHGENHDDNSKVLEFSAHELKSRLNRMLPGTLITINNEHASHAWQISLEVSPSLAAYGLPEPKDPQLDDQYVIHMEKEGGRILGTNGRSVLLAVYRYLRHLGCRFLRPGNRFQLVPVLEDRERLYFQCQAAAGYRHRGVCIEGADSLENVLDFVDWLPKLGYNSFFLQFQVPYTFLAKWYNHEGNPLAKPEGFSMEDAIRLCQVIEKEMKKRGLILHQAGHGWTGGVLGYLSCSWEQEDQEPGEEQKQMMALVGGERKLHHGVPLNTNLCFSNPEATARFADQVAEYAKNHPEVDYLHVWLADECNNVCECPQCQKTTPSDQYVRLLNQIDQKLTQMGLGTKIVFLLYQELLWPPKDASFSNPDRFVLMFAPISRTFESSYQLKGQYGPIPPYVRNHIALPVNLDENMAFLRKWQEQFKGDGFVYDYPLGRAHYGDLGYVGISQVIGKDIAQLSKMGLDGYISCQELRAALPNALPNYVMGLLLFDPSLSFCQVMEEYFQGAYGKEHKQVAKYLARLSELSSCDYVNGKGSRNNEKVQLHMAHLEALVEGFRPVIEKQVAQSKGLEKTFWEHLAYHGEYCQKLGKALRLLAGGQKQEAKACWEDFRDLVRQREAQFQECLDVYRVLEVTGKYAGF